MKKFSVFVLVLFVFGLFFMYGESTPKYVKMMKDKKFNFFDVVKEADKYFKYRDKGKGSGWKQFKRWEYFWGQRLYPSGERSNLADPVQEVADFLGSRSSGQASIQAANWVSLGPVNYDIVTGHWSPGLGRINDIELDPNNSSIIYVGTPSGGLWRSTTGGNEWTPLTDHIPAIGVSCILIDPTDSNTIYIGTGDKDAYDCWSRGVLKSTDGGATWDTTGLSFVPTDWQQVHKMLMHPNDSNTLFAGTYYGLYKSTDGAATWNLVADGDFDDLEFKPGDPTVVYGVTNNVPSPIFYRSTDGGNTWAATSMTATRRAQIAVTPANAEYVYFFSKDKGLYRSTNSGVSWTRMGRAPTAGSQDWYDLAMAVSPTNTEEVHVGEIETYVTFNCGKRWTKTSVWYIPNNVGYIHCDIHEMEYFGNRLYIGSDGLITYTDDFAESFTDLSVGLGIRQFYRMGSGVNGNPYKLIGGSQDNGTSVYSSDHWQEWLGADGMECVINYNNENICYGAIQYGDFYKSDNGGANEVSISQPGNGDWVTPYVIDPINPDTLYVGNAYVRKTTDGMQSWTTIGSFGDGNVNAIAAAKSDPNYIYAAKDERIWRTTNGGGSWTEITGTLPGYFVTYISVHPSDPLKVAVTLSSFWTYADGEKVFISANAGDTWTNYSANLPNLPATCVVYHGGSNDAMYVGMDVGIYYRDNTLSNWVAYWDGLPNVIANELEIDNSIQKIRVATYGRGMWESNLYSTVVNPPVADFTANNTAIYEGDTVNFSDLSTNNPTSWSWTFAGGTPGTSSLKNPSVTYDTEGTYTVTLIATNSAGSDTETKIDYITVTWKPQLPTYCSSAGSDYSKEWISQVAVGSFSNSSGASGYSDFTDLTIELAAGSNASVTLTPGRVVGKPQTEFWKIWIDYNADGDFDDPGEEVFSGSGGSNTVVSGSFNVASVTAYTGLRVSMKRDSYAAPCETFAYGEVEDYAVNITGAAAASLPGNNFATVHSDAASGKLVIKHPGYDGSLLIRILDSAGKQVKKVMHNGGKTKTVNISDLPAGKYAAVLYNGRKEIKKSFVKK